MGEPIRDIYLLYIGLKESIESVSSVSSSNKSFILFKDEEEVLWYKGNIIELHSIAELLEEIK